MEPINRTIAVFHLLQQILLNLQPTDILILHTNRKPDYKLDVVVDTIRLTQPTSILQIQEVDVSHKSPNLPILARPSNSVSQYRLLNILLTSESNPNLLDDYMHQLAYAVKDFYLHTTLVLVPVCRPQTSKWDPKCVQMLETRSHMQLTYDIENVIRRSLPFDDDLPGVVTIVATFDSKLPLVDILHVTRDHRRWFDSVDAFIDDTQRTQRLALARNATCPQLTAQLRHHMPVALAHIDWFSFSSDHAQMTSAKENDFNGPLIEEALVQHFDTCIQSATAFIGQNGSTVLRLFAEKRQQCSVAFRSKRFRKARIVQFFSLVKGKKIEAIILKQRPFVMLVPNWWTKSVNFAIDPLMVVVYCVSTAAILFGFVGLRCWATQRRSLVDDRHRRRQPQQQRRSDYIFELLLDTSGRMLCIGQPERGLAAAVGIEYWFGVLASVWGLLNASTMTGELFDSSVGTFYAPVFGGLDAVLQHRWLPIVSRNTDLMEQMSNMEEFQ